MIKTTITQHHIQVKKKKTGYISRSTFTADKREKNMEIRAPTCCHCELWPSSMFSVWTGRRRPRLTWPSFRHHSSCLYLSQIAHTAAALHCLAIQVFFLAEAASNWTKCRSIHEKTCLTEARTSFFFVFFFFAFEWNQDEQSRTK